MQIPEVLECIFAIMGGIAKWQRDFLTELFAVIFSIQGRANFTNLSRYSSRPELAFRRHFSKFFDWLRFNMAFMEVGGLELSPSVIGAIDCSYLPKAGKCSYGLDKFWSGVAGRAKQGLEISLLCLINTLNGEAWSLYAEQTPSGLSGREGSKDDYTRVDHYLTHWRSCLSQLSAVVYFACDGFYAKTKVFEAFAQAHKHIITKFRADADLRYLYQGEQLKGKRGRKRRYDGKVNFKDLSRWQYVGIDHQMAHLELYTQVLNSPRFKRDFRVVLVRNTQLNRYILLACTDLELSARNILRFYQLRFQIEFLFRDAKQFAGLSHCQAREANRLHFHFNMSLAAINLARFEMKENQTKRSFNDFARKAYNRKLLNWFLTQLSPEAKLEINQTQIQRICEFGIIHQENRSKIRDF